METTAEKKQALEDLTPREIVNKLDTIQYTPRADARENDAIPIKNNIKYKVNFMFGAPAPAADWSFIVLLNEKYVVARINTINIIYWYCSFGRDDKSFI